MVAIFIDPPADYANSYYNRRHVFVTAGNWDLPVDRGQAFGGGVPGWLNQIIGGFSLNGTVTWDGGLPVTPTYELCSQDEDIDGTGGTLCRPNLAPGASVHGRWVVQSGYT